MLDLQGIHQLTSERWNFESALLVPSDTTLTGTTVNTHISRHPAPVSSSSSHSLQGSECRTDPSAAVREQGLFSARRVSFVAAEPWLRPRVACRASKKEAWLTLLTQADGC